MTAFSDRCRTLLVDADQARLSCNDYPMAPELHSWLTFIDLPQKHCCLSYVMADVGTAPIRSIRIQLVMHYRCWNMNNLSQSESPSNSDMYGSVNVN